MKTTFVPMLAISKATYNIDFYKNAFGAVELRRWNNDDGSIHVAELSIDGAIFHLHEERPDKGTLSPEQHPGVTATIGLMVADVDTVMVNAITAGATEISSAKNYDYGYRQGEIKDPFGHLWLIEQAI